MKKTLTVVTLLAASTSQAAGFAIDTQGGRATGMGSAGVASSQDAASIFYNPAGILGVNKVDAQLGASLIAPRISFTPEGGTQQTQMPFSPPPYAYFAYKLNEQMAVGVGAFTPFGANSQWPDDFVGRQLSLRSQLATYDINPTVAYAPLPWLRLGAGAQVMYGTVDLSRRLNFGTSEGTVRLSGNSWGFGFNAGVQADVVPGLVSLGVQYRSQVGMGFAGEADFQDVPQEAAPSVPPDQPIRANVRMPASLGLGLAVTPLKRLLVAADATWVQWSSFPELLIEFQTTPQANMPAPKNWRNRVNLRLGGEYGLTEALAVRAGFTYDPTPSPENTLSPDLPDATRLKFSVGAGYAFSAFRVDAGYQFVLLREQRSTFTFLPGTHSSSAHLLASTLGYSQ